MKAVVINSFGGPEVFQIADLPEPKVEPGHVVIQVKGSSVNQVDCKIRSGAIPSITPPFPAVLHGDVSGVVIEVGPDVTTFKTGDEVYGCSGGVKGTGGALAEYMLCDVQTLAKKPKLLPLQDAAALPLVTITAWIALFYKLNFSAGHHILIHGGAGGVGSTAIQLAKSVGGNISTTVGSETDFAAVKKLGSQGVINYHKEGVQDYVKRLTENQGFEMIFDTIGEKNLPNSFQAAALNGAIATTAARSTLDLTPMHQKALSLHSVFMLLPLLNGKERQMFKDILDKAATLVDAGKLVPFIDSNRFHILDVAKAHAYLESKKTKGKVVLHWDMHKRREESGI